MAFRSMRTRNILAAFFLDAATNLLTPVAAQAEAIRLPRHQPDFFTEPLPDGWSGSES